MATFRVTDPNSGRTIRLTGDSPPTQQELEQIFSQFQIEQEPEIDPNILAQSPRFQEQVQAEQLARSVGPGEALAIGAGRGLTTIGRAVGLAEPEDPATARAFKALQEQRPITTTVGEIAGEAAPFLLPGGFAARAVTVPGRVLASGALAATEAGAIARGRGAEDVETLKAAGIGGTLAGAAEVVLPVVGRLGSRLVRRALNRAPTAPILDAAGNPSPELAEALNKSGLSVEDLGVEANRLLQAGDAIDPKSVARRTFLEDQGIVPTRAQITGEAADFQAQQELAKTSGRVRRALSAQEEQLGGQFENAVTATGGSANRSSSTAFDHIADRSIELDSAIGDAYKAARAAAPTAQVVRVDGLVKEMRSIAGSEGITGGLVGAVKDTLKNKGILGQKGFKIQGRVTPEVAEEVRIEMNALFNSLTPRGREKLRDFKNALDDDVAGAVGEDVFAGARSAKAKFEKDLSRTKINKFDQRKKSLVREILENKVNPDRFLDDAVLNKSIRSADVEQLKRFLLLDGDGPGLDSWNDIRAEALQRIKDQSFKEVAGERALSRAGLEKSLDQIGRDKLRVLFSQEERKFLSDMLKVSKLREPVRGTALGRGPSAQAIGRLENVVKRIPLLANVFEGIATDAAGRIALRQPSITAPLIPLPAGATAAIPALTAITAQAGENPGQQPITRSDERFDPGNVPPLQIGSRGTNSRFFP